jgi:hypothetical protein
VAAAVIKCQLQAASHHCLHMISDRNPSTAHMQKMKQQDAVKLSLGAKESCIRCFKTTTLSLPAPAQAVLTPNIGHQEVGAEGGNAAVC